VNALPGVDRQIISTDIGKLNLSVGIVHRGATTAPAAAPGRWGATDAADRVTVGGPPQACGQASSAPAAPGTATGIMHDHQTETYIIVSGSGTLVTGGQIVNGRKSAPDSNVTLVLNGPPAADASRGPTS